mmetsp:Transcript_25890/g.38306  ORF Transcript_25890/g.38306 Transcript_25890/m.38306 type:complete len:150 (-) Transcript_25890:997-1446(-)
MSELLTLMGVKVHSTNWCDYSNAHVPSWPAVQRHLLSHSQEVFLHHMPSEDYPHITFSPLCICLRNEVHPVPLYFIDTLLDLDARALTDDLLVNVACRTPHLSGESLSICSTEVPMAHKLACDSIQGKERRCCPGSNSLVSPRSYEERI